MMLGSITSLQRTFLLHPQLSNILLGIFALFVIAYIIDDCFNFRRCEPYLFALVVISCIFTAIVTWMGCSNDSTARKLVHPQPVKIVKVTHTSGADDYVATAVNGHQYMIDRDQVTISTASSKPNATLTRYVPNADTTSAMMHAAKQQLKMPQDRLKMHIAPMNDQTQTWHFK